MRSIRELGGKVLPGPMLVVLAIAPKATAGYVVNYPFIGYPYFGFILPVA